MDPMSKGVKLYKGLLGTNALSLLDSFVSYQENEFCLSLESITADMGLTKQLCLSRLGWIGLPRKNILSCYEH